MAFIESKCPNCGGELRIPDDRATIKCMYCSSEIVVRQAIRKSDSVNLDNILNLAKTAKDSGNYEDAYKYYSRVLEVDQQNCEAWLGFGESAGRMSSFKEPSIEEMLSAFNKATQCTSDSRAIETKISVLINSVSFDFYKSASAHILKFMTDTRTLNVYITRCFEILESMELAHKYSPRDTQIIGNIIFICKDNLEGVIFCEKFDTNGEPINQLMVLSGDVKEKFDLIMRRFIAKMKDVDASYRIPQLQTKVVVKKQQSQCFVVTATMGNPCDPTVILLQDFRDLYLCQSVFGRSIINFYNKIGPHMAFFIRESKMLRSISYFFLVAPFAFCAKLIMRNPGLRILRDKR